MRGRKNPEFQTQREVPVLTHETMDVTANVYIHTFEEGERRASSELERAIFPEAGHSCSQIVPRGEQEGHVNVNRF